MLTQNMGYPRIGGQRQLKKGSENYWIGKIGQAELNDVARMIRYENWKTQLEAGIDWQSFSFYDQTLDTSLLFGVIPQSYAPKQVRINNCNN